GSAATAGASSNHLRTGWMAGVCGQGPLFKERPLPSRERESGVGNGESAKKESDGSTSPTPHSLLPTPPIGLARRVGHQSADPVADLAAGLVGLAQRLFPHRGDLAGVAPEVVQRPTVGR